MISALVIAAVMLPGLALADGWQVFGPDAVVALVVVLPVLALVMLPVVALAELLRRSINYRRERDRKVREYQQALLDFRWHEGMSPIEFEQRCADYLSLRGWESTTTKGSGDQGVDVVACKNNIVLVVQCKKYSKPVGNKAVQEIIAAKAYMQATFAAVVSNQTYTPAAGLFNALSSGGLSPICNTCLVKRNH